MELLPKNGPLAESGFELSLETGDSLERRKLLKLEYSKSVDRFLRYRANESDSELSDDDARRVGMASLEANYDLLEDISTPEVADSSIESICTITIPVAILNEDINIVVSTIEQLKRSHGNNDQPIDIIIWANAKYTESDRSDVEENASKSYVEMVEKLHVIGDEKLRIKTALQLIPKEEFSMSQLRSNYMDAVTLDSLKRGYGFNHPVMWVDADTTRISKDVIQSLALPLVNNEALFTHANLQFSVDWSPDTLPGELDDATKAIILNEMQRRQRKALSEDGKDGGYVEESGLAFSIGVYLNAGGMDKTDPISESGRLILKVVKARDTGYLNEKGVIPASLDEYNGMFYEEVKHVKSARMAVSARRHYEVAKEQGAGGLYDVDKSGYGDTLFTDMEKSDEAANISQADMRELFEDNNRIWEASPTGRMLKSQAQRPNTTEKYIILQQKQLRNRKIANKLIERYFKD
jgi:hypothetical protein